MDHLFKKNVLQTYSNIANHFERTRYVPWPEMKWFSSVIPTGSTLADIGCGTGRNSIYLASLGHHVHGLDVVPEMISIAHRRAEEEGLKSTEFIMGDARNLPWGDAEMDAVVCIAAIHHIPGEVERMKAIQECWRIVRPGGKLLLSVWAREQERTKTFLPVEKDSIEGESAEGDYLVPWKREIDKKVFYRYYHLYTREMFENAAAVAVGEGIVFSHADNHQLYAVKGGGADIETIPGDIGGENSVSIGKK